MDENDIYDEIDGAELEPVVSPKTLQRRKECRELCRLFSEVNWAINCLKIVREIEGTCTELREGFLVFAYRSLWDDALACLMRVLDDHRDARSLWKIERRFQGKFEAVCFGSGINLTKIREFSERLQTARDKTHFHIDKKYAADADRLWSELNIKENEMIGVANDVARILGGLLSEEYQFPANLSRYDAADVRPIFECLDERGLGNFRKR
jgi:hypothetical protein